MQRNSSFSSHLDWIRGLAALEVFLGHLRQNTIGDYSSQYSFPVKLLYFLTSFGYESVLIFFVLSGYFVAGSVLSDHRRGRWSWGRYLVNRGSRLYTVLVPALVLGAAWDGLGIHLLGLPEVDLEGPIATHLNAPTGLGNLLFLQGILVKPFGSNSPLWSLSYEAWYYLLFPLLVGAARGASLPTRLGQLALAALILGFIGRHMASYFLLWMLGAAVAVAPQLPRWGGWLALGAGVFLGAGALGAIGTGRLPHSFGSDALVAVTFALALLGLRLLATAAPASPRYARAGTWLAGFSYTLYLVHAPPINFVKFSFFLGTHQPTAFNARGLGVTLALGATLILYAYLISRVTEARTDSLRRRLLGFSPTARTSFP
jgi:peptidoglycan/LPS O-acetylase OafA/YrhL